MFEVEEFNLCGGWKNNWVEERPDGSTHPETFSTRAEAQAEIDGLVEDMGYDPDNYRIREI